MILCSPMQTGLKGCDDGRCRYVIRVRCLTTAGSVSQRVINLLDFRGTSSLILRCGCV